MTHPSEAKPATADPTVWIDPDKESASLAGQLSSWILLMYDTASQLNYRGEYLIADLLCSTAWELEKLQQTPTLPRQPGVTLLIRIPLLKESMALLRTAALAYSLLGIVRNTPLLRTASDELHRLVGRYEEHAGERRCSLIT